MPRSGSIILSRDQLRHRTFVLGDQGGFLLYFPVEQNIHDRTLMPIKWFGASGFGRKFLEAVLVYACTEDGPVKLDRSNQTGFEQNDVGAIRVFEVGSASFRQRLFVPNRSAAFVMTLDADHEIDFCVEPEFDMRYYQEFNTDFSQYQAGVISSDEHPRLRVTNTVSHPTTTVSRLTFFALVGAPGGGADVEMLPEAQRLRTKTYLSDEQREKLIHGAFLETRQDTRDEAPIWNTYTNTVYTPARLTGKGPLTLVFAFGQAEGDAKEAYEALCDRVEEQRTKKRVDADRRLTDGTLSTGRDDVDTAYAQVLLRFNDALVARDVTIHAGGEDIAHFSSIFAGNKYFLDAWKRDENISLIGLLTIGDFETARAILDETWQHQDPRTGRLPQITRLGERPVYFSSDGTPWSLRRLHQYTRWSGDRSLLEAKYPMVERFFSASLSFVKRGLLPSGGIIDRKFRWETWEDTPFTPRDGYPVEIELLWLTDIEDYLPVVREHNPDLADRLMETLAEGRKTFELFYLDGYLADRLTYDWEPDTLLTPNGYVAFEVGYPLPEELKHGMVRLGREQLGGELGIRSLAPRDWSRVLSPDFMADPRNFRDGTVASVGIYNYHRGIEWPWLNQFFVAAELQGGDADEALHRYLEAQVRDVLHASGIGGLSELHDMRGDLGVDFQAWSMSGFLNALRLFAGAEVDALDRTISVRPALPRDWEEITTRERVGVHRFDVRSRRGADSQVIEVIPVGATPERYRLRLGVRVPAERSVGAIMLNGRNVEQTAWQVVPGCAEDVAGEAWVETAFDGRVSASFMFA